MPLPIAPADVRNPAQLTLARLRIAWQMLAEVGDHLDLLPVAARPHVARALSELAQGKAIVEEQGTGVQ
jgi:hypothetical protein